MSLQQSTSIQSRLVLVSGIVAALNATPAHAALPVSTSRAPDSQIVTLLDGELVEEGFFLTPSIQALGYGTLSVHLDIHGSENSEIIVRLLARHRPIDEFCYVRKDNGTLREFRWNQGRDDPGSQITFTGISAPEIALSIYINSSVLNPTATLTAYLE